MGVPKFYRWISERYPLINRRVDPHGVGNPAIDNLYLDMNGIIHNCARPPVDSRLHPSGFAPTPPIDDLFLNIFRYIEQLIALADPRSLLYMAVDGVAPRAKMNQQRSRRFRSAREREEEAQKRGSSATPPFDSNCITPGTEFMARLSEALKYFVHKKMRDDARWRAMDVIVSGAEAPGEGEHKIMAYIRDRRAAGTIQPNTRHCLYGLDADLIMLGLVTHEPHFFLLREKVDFTSFLKKRPGPRQQTTLDTLVVNEFEFLSIGVLREYLDLEFRDDSIAFYDLERCIDDFVFMCFLIGNDFLPNLPLLEIRDGALTIMMKLYKHVLPRFGGYINTEGKIDFSRLEVFLSKLGQLETPLLAGRKNAGGRKKSNHVHARDLDHAQLWGFSAPADMDEYEGLQYLSDSDSEKLSAELLDELERDEPEQAVVPRRPWTEDELQSALEEAAMHSSTSTAIVDKRVYYNQKLGIDMDNVEALSSLRRAYVEGLVWTLAYYYQGCQSWRWYYPYHYAPMASDMVGLRQLGENVHLDLGEPFLPMQQLLSVLPAASAWCLPAPYQELMKNRDSPIIDFYPMDFKTDLNGKRNEWEAVVLLPFVDEQRLIAATRSIPPQSLSSSELSRNRLGSARVFRCPKSKGSHPLTTIRSPSPKLPTVESAAIVAQFTEVLSSAPFSSKVAASTRSVANCAALDDLPTLATKSVSHRHGNVGVNVFGMVSRDESLVVEILEDTASDKRLPATASAAAAIESGMKPGARLYVDYPWKCEALVVRIRDSDRVVYSAADSTQVLGSDGACESRDNNPNESSRFRTEALTFVNDLIVKRGLRIPEPKVVVDVRLSDIVDSATKCAVSFKDKTTTVPGNCILFPLRQAHVPQKPKCLRDGDSTLYIGPGPFNCCVAEVLSLTKHSHPRSRTKSKTMVNLKFAVPYGLAREVSFGREIAQLDIRQGWFMTRAVANAIGIPVVVLSKITGSARFKSNSLKDNEDIDLGLGLKYSGRGLCVPGFCRMDETGQYVYSQKAVDALRDYRNSFPEVFELVGTAMRTEQRTEGEKIFDLNLRFKSTAAVQYIQRVLLWRAKLECSSLPLLPAASHLLSRDAIMKLEKRADESRQTVTLEGKRLMAGGASRSSSATREDEAKNPCRMTATEDRSTLLSGEESHATNREVHDDNLQLGDRVVHWRAAGSVPFGLRGTVVGIHSGIQEGIEIVFDETFVGGTSLHGRCSESRGKALSANSVLKLVVARSSGRREVSQGQVVPGRSFAAATGSGGTVPSNQPGRHPASEQLLHRPSPEARTGCAAAHTAAKAIGLVPTKETGADPQGHDPSEFLKDLLHIGGTGPQRSSISAEVTKLVGSQTGNDSLRSKQSPGRTDVPLRWPKFDGGRADDVVASALTNVEATKFLGSQTGINSSHSEQSPARKDGPVRRPRFDGGRPDDGVCSALPNVEATKIVGARTGTNSSRSEQSPVRKDVPVRWPRVDGGRPDGGVAPALLTRFAPNKEHSDSMHSSQPTTDYRRHPLNPNAPAWETERHANDAQTGGTPKFQTSQNDVTGDEAEDDAAAVWERLQMERLLSRPAGRDGKQRSSGPRKDLKTDYVNGNEKDGRAGKNSTREDSGGVGSSSDSSNKIDVKTSNLLSRPRAAKSSGRG